MDTENLKILNLNTQDNIVENSIHKICVQFSGGKAPFEITWKKTHLDDQLNFVYVEKFTETTDNQECFYEFDSIKILDSGEYTVEITDSLNNCVKSEPFQLLIDSQKDEKELEPNEYWIHSISKIKPCPRFIYDSSKNLFLFNEIDMYALFPLYVPKEADTKGFIYIKEKINEIFETHVFKLKYHDLVKEIIQLKLICIRGILNTINKPALEEENENDESYDKLNDFCSKGLFDNEFLKNNQNVVDILCRLHHIEIKDDWTIGMKLFELCKVNDLNLNFQELKKISASNDSELIKIKDLSEQKSDISAPNINQILKEIGELKKYGSNIITGGLKLSFLTIHDAILYHRGKMSKIQFEHRLIKNFSSTFGARAGVYGTAAALTAIKGTTMAVAISNPLILLGGFVASWLSFKTIEAVSGLENREMFENCMVILGFSIGSQPNKEEVDERFKAIEFIFASADDKQDPTKDEFYELIKKAIKHLHDNHFKPKELNNIELL